MADEIQGDEPQGPAAEVSAAALEVAQQEAAERGLVVLAGYTMVLLAPEVPEELEEGERPRAHGGMWVVFDAERGPDEPRQMLDFLLSGAAAFAQAQGLEFRTMEIPAEPGQG